MNNRIGPTVKYVAMVVLHNFWYAINTTAYHMGRYSLQFLLMGNYLVEPLLVFFVMAIGYRVVYLTFESISTSYLGTKYIGTILMVVRLQAPAQLSNSPQANSAAFPLHMSFKYTLVAYL